MTSRTQDIACNALAGVLASAAWAVGTYAWDHEAELLRRANAKAGAVLTPVEIPQVVESAVPAVESPPESSAPAPLTDFERRQQTFSAAWAEWERLGLADGEKHRLAAKCWVESRYRPGAVSPVGAAGPCQFMARTWDEEAPRTDPSCEGVHPSDPTCAARAAHSYNRRIEGWLARDARSPENVDAAYNWGAGNVNRAAAKCRNAPGCQPTSARHMDRYMPTETQRYRKRNREVKIGLDRNGINATFGFSF